MRLASVGRRFRICVAISALLSLMFVSSGRALVDVDTLVNIDSATMNLGAMVTVNARIQLVTDLAGMETDIVFDERVLEAVEVDELDFLKAGGATTFWLPGTIDNINGRISGIRLARIGPGGANGGGPLFSVKFRARAAGEGYVSFSGMQLGNSKGEAVLTRREEGIITVRDPLPQDINRDARVDILDLVLVAQSFGQAASAANARSDINGDGWIDILDLILVAQNFGKTLATAGAPQRLTSAQFGYLERILDSAPHRNDTLRYDEGIGVLRRLLLFGSPAKSRLLTNYPNPFNPETWIPFELKEGSDVTVTVFDVSGNVVRRLDLGYREPGYYTSREEAAFWDGRNELGERVSSGVYVVEFRAGQTRDLRRVAVLK